jgi:hypothetical protein
MAQFQTTTFGLPMQSQGSSLYGGVDPATWEETHATTASPPGLGKRMARRNFVTKFGDAFKTTGADTIAFKAGARVHVSVSNFSDPGFTYAAAVILGGSWQTTYLDPLCARIAALPFNSPVASGSAFGGYTQPQVDITFQHEVNQKAKAGAYGSSVAATPAEYKAFCKFFNTRLVAAGCRAKVNHVLISSGGVDYNAFLGTYWDATIFDEFGPDPYNNMTVPGFTWNGSTASFATNIAPILAAARAKGIQQISFPEFGLGDAHTSVMRQWWIDAANYILTITDVKIRQLLHWGQANHPDQNINYSAAQDTGSVGTVTQRAHPEQHDGIVQFMAIMQGNEILTGAAPTTPPKLTGLVATSATDGKSINLVWAAPGSPGDRIDFYIQNLTTGDTFLHKDNPAGLPTSPRSYSFSKNVAPGQNFLVDAVLYDSTTTLRSGFSTPSGLPVTTSTPGAGNTAPHIVSATATVDATDPLHFTLAAVATDPDPGQTLSYSWAITNSRTGVLVATLTGATVEHHAQTADPFDALLSVTDSAATPLTTQQHVTYAVTIGTGYTDNYHLRMLQANEDVRQMGPIERATKPSIDDLLWTANHRRTGYLVRHRLLGANYDPGAQAGTNVVTPVAKDLWFTTITMEAEAIAHLRTTITVSQQGSGALGCFFDPDSGQIFNGVDPFSIDAWLQNTALGMVDMDTPQQITGFDPGDPAIFGWWWPPTGITRFPAFRVRTSGGVQAFVPSKGISIWGSYNNLTSFPTQLDLTAAITQPEIWLGVPE